MNNFINLYIIQKLTLTYKNYINTIHYKFKPIKLINLEYLNYNPKHDHLSLKYHYIYHNTTSKHTIRKRLHNKFILNPKKKNPNDKN